MSQGNGMQTKDGDGGLCVVRLEPSDRTVQVPVGTLLEEAISQAGLPVPLPCGGQGRCGRCVVQVREGSVRRRSALRLSEDDISRGYALACQTLINEDVTVWVPPHEEQVQRLETGDRAEKAAPEVVVCEHPGKPWVERYHVTVEAPSLGDNTPDLERLQRELVLQHEVRDVQPTLTALAKLPAGAARG